MPTLFEITDNIRELDTLFDESGGLDEDARKQLEAVLCDAETDFAAKCDNYVALIKEYEATAKARKEEAARMAGLASVDMNKAASMKSALKYCMELLDVRKMKTDRYNIGIQKNGGKLPVIIEDEGTVPEYFVRLIPQIDRKAIGEALEAGQEVAGCSLGERGESLRIR